MPDTSITTMISAKKRTNPQLWKSLYGLASSCLLTLILSLITIGIIAGSGKNWITSPVEIANIPLGRPALYEDRVAWVDLGNSNQTKSTSEIVNPVSWGKFLPSPTLSVPVQEWSLWPDSPTGYMVVMVYDLVTGQIWDLSDDLPQCLLNFIDMYGDWVVTEQNCPLESIHGFNLQTNEYLAIAPYEGDLITHQLPSIDENYVLWVDVDGCCSSDIRMFDLDSHTTISVTNDGGGGTNYEYFPDKSGDWIVWVSGGSFDIYAYNLTTTEKITITNDPARQWYPRIDNNIVVWTDERNDSGDVYGYDLELRQEFPVADGSGSQYSPSIQGGLVSWTEYQDDTLFIRGLDLGTGEYFDIFEHPPGTSLLEPSVAYGDRVAWQFDNYNEGMSYLYTAKRLRFQSYLPLVVR